MAIFRYSGNWGSYLEGTSSTVSQDIAGNSSVIKVDVWIGMDAGRSMSMKVEDIIIDDDVGFDLAIIGDDDLGDDGDGEQIFEDLSNSTVQLVDVPDW